MAEIPGNRMYRQFSPSLESQAKAGVLAYEGRPWVKVKGVRGNYRIDKISFRGCIPVPSQAEMADTAPV